eukprot:CAMPEP_0180204228 /NCGR_PEP_ID=MMETSP0987-20121128/8304_1 /TAXON_ID=697907 /ORGANISM="non described non described, Strain CCMP2293" /LENGTH=255 /DNA_ID=CAMNT_0022159713 /DNA_START=505 /DNA_END=1273 /DNA_ORIENTATION=-
MALRVAYRGVLGLIAQGLFKIPSKSAVWRCGLLVEVPSTPVVVMERAPGCLLRLSWHGAVFCVPQPGIVAQGLGSCANVVTQACPGGNLRVLPPRVPRVSAPPELLPQAACLAVHVTPAPVQTEPPSGPVVPPNTPAAQRAPSPRGTLFHKGDAVRPPAKLKALALPCNCIKAGEAAAAAALRSVVAMKRGKGDRRASIGCWRRARLASYTTPREIPRCQVVQLQLQARPAIQRRCVCVRSGGGQRESPHDDPVL